MRVYVASSFHNKDQVRSAMFLLQKAGHTITMDWTPEDAGDRTGNELTLYLANAARKDLNGVRTAEVVIVLHDDRGRGMATEFGAALGYGIPVIIVGARDITGHMKNIFYHLPLTHVETMAEVIRVLAA